MRPSAAEVAGRTYDVMAIGGEINGSGIARKAALRDLSVLLTEEDDFCTGAR